MSIFQFVSSKQDISSLFLLKFVCRQWLNAISDHPITMATITIPKSINWYDNNLTNYLRFFKSYFFFCFQF
jgi:hypothetical protein